MAVERSENSYFEVLPPELLFLIRDIFETTDLKTHVCFFHSSPRAAALYGDSAEQEAYWMKMCWINGIGLLPGENRRNVSWEQIALDVIEREWFCEHPQCGLKRLEKNMVCMSESENLDAPTQALLHAEGELEPSTFFKHIEYVRLQDKSFYMKPEEDAHLHEYAPHPSQPSQPPPTQTSRLWEHPIACRSFAVFPPVQQLQVMDLLMTMYPDVERSTGVTVWDVQAAVQTQLDCDIDRWGLVEFADRHEECIPKSWSFSKTLREIGTLRGAFSLVRWDGFDLAEDGEDGPVWCLIMTPRPKSQEVSP